jgi:hypothetical protein
MYTTTLLKIEKKNNDPDPKSHAEAINHMQSQGTSTTILIP